MLGSECDFKIYVRNLEYPIPGQIGGPKTTYFRRVRKLTATLTAYIFRTKHDIHNWKLLGISYVISKCHEFGQRTA